MTACRGTPLPSAARSVEHDVAADVPLTPQRSRTNFLTPIIERAQAAAPDGLSAAAVWVELQRLAAVKVAPLYGATDEGIQYLKDGAPLIFTRQALGERLKRASAPRRRDTVRHGKPR